MGDLVREGSPGWTVPGLMLQDAGQGNKGTGGRGNQICLLEPSSLVTSTNSRERVTFTTKNKIFKGRSKLGLRNKPEPRP